MTDILYLSTSLVAAWDLCGMRAVSNHRTRLEEGDDESGQAPLAFGNIVHEVAEEYHQREMSGQDVPDPIELFDERWSTYQITDLDYYELGRSNIEGFLERTLFDREGDTIAVELPFIMDLTHGEIWPLWGVDQPAIEDLAKAIVERGGVPIRSKIDRIDRDGNFFEVYDYKTNAMPFTRDEVDNSLQLFIYDQAVRALYPEAEHVRCTFDMLRHGRFSTIFEPSKREILTAYLQNIWTQITTLEPRPTLNKFCSWCHLKQDCEVYQDALGHEVSAVETDEMTPEDLWAEYDELSNVKKIVRDRRSELKGAIHAHIQENDGKPIQIGEDREIYLVMNPKYEYPIDDAYEIFKRHDALSLLKQCASISRPKLDRAVRGRVPLIESFKKVLDTYYVSPTPKVRKAKDASDSDD